jgi:hypothetical protein
LIKDVSLIGNIKYPDLTDRIRMGQLKRSDLLAFFIHSQHHFLKKNQSSHLFFTDETALNNVRRAYQSPVRYWELLVRVARELPLAVLGYWLGEGPDWVAV